MGRMLKKGVIAISGAVGSGKTSFAKLLSSKIGARCIHLNDLVKDYKIKEVKNLDTFDFDLDEFLDTFEKELKTLSSKELIVIESHFAHFISPELINLLLILNRDLPLLKKEYKKRRYSKQKISDNLEVETFNLCFYEAEEIGYEIESKELFNQDSQRQGKVLCLENEDSLENLVERVVTKLL